MYSCFAGSLPKNNCTSVEAAVFILLEITALFLCQALDNIEDLKAKIKESIREKSDVFNSDVREEDKVYFLICYQLFLP